MKRNRLLKSQHQDVFNMFEMGLSQCRIADNLNVPVSAVRRIISEQYPDFSGRRYLNIKEIVAKYKKGQSVSSLADEYETTIKTVQSRLLAEDIELRPVGEERRKHFFNENFFEVIDSEEKAYWLGFIFADGCVSSRMNDVSIALAKKDYAHLEKFLGSIGYDGKGLIKNYSGTGYGVDVEYCKVSLRSKKMAADLVAKGCLPKKSLDCGPPNEIPDHLVLPFIRGLVDGDGYVSGHGVASLEIVGSYRILEWVAKRLEISEPRPHKSIWRIRTSGKNARDKMKLLYQDATVYMERKKIRAEVNYE